MGNIKKGGLYCAYLRKSRRDVELEALGQGETLARHEKQLTELAARLGIHISQTYREIVSGDTIAARPQIQQLLSDINDGMWDGVLVMDVDRLARGDSIDQGIIMQSMMYAGVLVVTPDKIYDPNDDSDAEFFEIKLFFSRREYAQIKKRLQRGRLASVMEGCYMSPPLYGYERYKLVGRRGWSLKPIPAQADIVRSIFSWYAYGMDGMDVGAESICNRLNGMGVPSPRGKLWESSTIRNMLHNPTYIGMIQWNVRTTQRSIKDGQRVVKRPLNDNPVLVKGLHEGIVDVETFEKVQHILSTHAKRPRNVDAPVVNPLSGLLICGQCGRRMQMKPSGNRRDCFFFCPLHHCKTAHSYVGVVEGVVLDGLRAWVEKYEAQDEAPDAIPDADAVAINATRAQLLETLDTLNAQRDRQFDLLERGVYTDVDFLRRRAEIDAQIQEAQKRLEALTPAPTVNPIVKIIPQVRTVLGAYDIAATPAEKLALYSSVIDHIVYDKTQRCYRNNKPTDHLTLTLYPRIPQELDKQNDGGF